MAVRVTCTQNYENVVPHDCMTVPHCDISCFVDRAYRYNRVMQNQLMRNLFLVYFVNLYTFRANLGPSSGGTTVYIQHLVLSVVLDGWRLTKYTKNKLVFLYTTHCDILTVKNALVKVRATSRSAPFGVSFDF
jgi:hypothetical protein